MFPLPWSSIDSPALRSRGGNMWRDQLSSPSRNIIISVNQCCKVLCLYIRFSIEWTGKSVFHVKLDEIQIGRYTVLDESSPSTYPTDLSGEIWVDEIQNGPCWGPNYVEKQRKKRLLGTNPFQPGSLSLYRIWGAIFGLRFFAPFLYEFALCNLLQGWRYW